MKDSSPVLRGDWGSNALILPDLAGTLVNRAFQKATFLDVDQGSPELFLFPYEVIYLKLPGNYKKVQKI